MDDTNKKPLSDDETVLSVTAMPDEAAPAPDNTVNIGDGSTILSATAVENLQTLAKDADKTEIVENKNTHIDDNKTALLDSTGATIVRGATQALHTNIKTDGSPKIFVGSVINNRFTLEKLLGRGGMGEVYLATDLRKLEAQDKNPYIAIKVLGENFKRHPQAFVALQREARKTQELAHPNIVTVYDFDRQGNTAYLTMEALSGKPMDEEIRGDARSISEACAIIIQCARGLAYAHEKGLVHSDLKPGNIFLTEDNHAKLLDFGIARAFKSGKDLDQKKLTNDTVFDAGELGALTPAYATCEMLEGAEPHPADDVYALGLIAYELLTGQHPFNKTMASKAEEQGLKPLRIKGLNKQQWRAIEHALAFRRENRTANATQFLKEFTAKSKTPLYIASVLILAAFIGVASMNLFIEPERGPDVAFADLPVKTQQSITALIQQADEATQFQDYNSVLLLLNKAFLLHPYDKQVMQKLDQTVNALLPLLNKLDKPTRVKQLQALMQYEALKENKTLKKQLKQWQ